MSDQANGPSIEMWARLYYARGPVSSEVVLVSVVADEALKPKARPDLILRRVEDGQGVHEEPPAEWREGELVPDDLSQENCEVEAVPALAEKCRQQQMVNGTTLSAGTNAQQPPPSYPLCAAKRRAGGSSGIRGGPACPCSLSLSA